MLTKQDLLDKIEYYSALQKRNLDQTVTFPREENDSVPDEIADFHQAMMDVFEAKFEIEMFKMMTEIVNESKDAPEAVSRCCIYLSNLANVTELQVFAEKALRNAYPIIAML
jgi:hypothetical protein